MFKILVDYPNFQEEFEVARRTTGIVHEQAEQVLSGTEIVHLQNFVRSIEVSENVIRYALAIVRQTRVTQDGAPDFVREQVGWGAGPRAVQFLIIGAKARAALLGRSRTSPRAACCRSSCCRRRSLTDSPAWPRARCSRIG